MQTLGVSDSALKSESRLKSLLWPSIQSGSDLDYLGIQGYWVCTIVAFMTLLLGLFSLGASSNPVVAIFIFCSSVLFCLFFYIGGIGVREGSRFAAAMAFSIYTIDMLLTLYTQALTAGALVRIAFTLVLLSNLRATWIAASWLPGMDESALPPRRNQSFSDKFVDQWPRWIWPKIRIPYYVFSFFIALLTVAGLFMRLFRRA